MVKKYKLRLKSVNKPAEINEIKIGYYSDSLGEKQEFYKPIWIFKGKDGAGDNMTRYVNAVFPNKNY